MSGFSSMLSGGWTVGWPPQPQHCAGRGTRAMRGCVLVVSVCCSFPGTAAPPVTLCSLSPACPCCPALLCSASPRLLPLAAAARAFLSPRMHATCRMSLPQDHLTGKQYLGWKKIRETYAEIIKQRDDRMRGGPLPERVRSSSREGAAAAAERGSSRDRDRERERERGSSRDRDYRGGSSRDYRGSSGGGGRDRDYRPRDRDYDRERYDRRDRSRSPGRRHRVGDRDYRDDRDHHRSRYSEYPPPGYGSRSSEVR